MEGGKSQGDTSERVKLIIGWCQSPLRQPAECGCAITEPDYRHPPGDAAPLSRNNAGSRNGDTGKTV